MFSTFAATVARVLRGRTALRLLTQRMGPSSTPSDPAVSTPSEARPSSTVVLRSLPNFLQEIGSGPLSGCYLGTMHTVPGPALARLTLWNREETMRATAKVATTSHRALCILDPVPNMTAGGSTTSSARRYIRRTPRLTIPSVSRFVMQLSLLQNITQD